MIAAIIMAGGKGERFWPLSRETTPKQCLAIISGKTMLEDTISRLKPLFPIKNIFIATNSQLAQYMKKFVPHANYIIEPIGRDTAACIGLSAIQIMRKDPNAIMFIETTDHVYGNPKEYLEHIKVAIELAKENNIVLIGINPTYPSTGFGYIRHGNLLKNRKIKAYKISEFKEKPDLETAKEFLESANYLWNSGVFVSKCSVMLDAIKQHMPQLYSCLSRIQKSIFNDKVIKEEFAKLDKVSIDYGVMEKAHNTVVIRANMHWDDVGDWKAMERINKKDKNGNVVKGKFLGIDTNDCIIYGDNLVAAYGLKDLIIVNSKDAVLVVPKGKAQKVKDLVKAMGMEKKFGRYL